MATQSTGIQAVPPVETYDRHKDQSGSNGTNRFQQLHRDDVFSNDKAILAIIGSVAAVAIAITLAATAVNPLIIAIPIVFSALLLGYAEKNLICSEGCIADWAGKMHTELLGDKDAVNKFLKDYKTTHNIDDCHALQLVDHLERLSLTTEQKKGVQQFRETMPSFPPHYRLHLQIQKLRKTIIEIGLSFPVQITV